MNTLTSKRARRRAKGEPKAIRYAFYSVLIVLIVSMPVLSELYLNNIVSSDTLNALASIALSLVFSFAVLSYLLIKGRTLGKIADELGLSGKFLSTKNVLIGVCIFVFVPLLGLLLQWVSDMTGIPLPTNVAELLTGMPLYFLVFSFLIAPINEEVLFRGFLVSRIGIFASAVLFAIPHLLSYSSISELIAAFAFGIVSGYAYKKTGSLYPSIFAHVLVNLITILPFL